MTPYYEHGGITIWHGDCRVVLPLVRAECIVSDPPWGADTQCNAQRFTRASSPWWDNVDMDEIVAHEDIEGDAEPFDPAVIIARNVPTILWGANHFARCLPVSGGWLVWDKRRGAESLAEKGWPLGEAELAWTNVRGSVRVFRNLWSGLLRSSEKGEFYHPTQKPVALMMWCLGFVGGRVLDPYMGAGSTLIAAKQLGRQAIGIEIEERYCEIAAQRLEQEVLPLHAEPTPEPEQGALLS